jgi:serine/threonine-protein kinase
MKIEAGRDDGNLGADLWPRVSRALDEVYARGADERAAYLAELAGREPAVHREVVALLAADPETSRRLDEPARAVAASWLEGGEATAQVRVGDWRLLRPLGRGGMGEVFLVERATGDFEQRAALKLLKRGLDSAEVLGRFLRERQILARLEHPGIARLLDGGVASDGRPYYVLELVDGLPITRYAEAKGLGVEARLRLLVAVCEAVGAAHRSLVVHRDLKPSNVLVGRTGEVKLLDFGIAKLLEDEGAEATRTELRRMTPAYAAPEQILGGPITTATDVYALGAIAYELLVGERPFPRHGRTPTELALEVGEERLERPSAALDRRSRAVDRGEMLRRRAKRVAGDLDAILETALAPESSRRYPTVDALVEDLRHHLERRPIRARGNSWSYRTSRFVTRHRVAIATAALLSVAIGAGVTAELWQARQTAREARRARAVQGFLVSIFESADPSHTLGQTIPARQILAEGVRRLDRELGADRGARAEIEDAMARSYVGIGAGEEAADLAAKAVADFSATLGPDAPRTAAAIVTAGEAEQLRTKPDPALADAERALPLLARGYGDRSLEVARAHELASHALTRKMKIPAAIEHMRAATEITREKLGEDAPETARRIGSLAELHGYLGQMAVAEAGAQDALARLARAGAARSPQAMELSSFLGELAEYSGRADEADARFRESIAIAREILGPRHPQLGQELVSFGGFLSELHRAQEAEPILREGIAILEPLGHIDAATAMVSLARTYRWSERFADSEAMAMHAEEFAARIGGPDAPMAHTASLEVGATEVAMGKWVEAERRLRSEAGSATRVWGRGTDDEMHAEKLLADCLRELGRVDQAIALHRRDLERVRAAEQRGGRGVASEEHLALALDLVARRGAGDLDEARRLLDEAIADERGPRGRPYRLGPLLAASGRLELARGDRPRARRELEEAAALLGAELDPSAPSLVALRRDLAAARRGSS